MLMGYMSQFGQVMATAMFLRAIIPQWFQDQFRAVFEKYFHKYFIAYFYPYVQISFHEYNAASFKRNRAYGAIERYLGTYSLDRAKRLKANVVKDCQSVVLSIDEYEEVTDEFKGVTIWWLSSKIIPPRERYYEKRFYTLTCHRKHRDFVTKVYIKHVLDEGKSIAIKARQRKLYTNNKSDNWHSHYYNKIWSHIIFEHPSTFGTLAMDPKKKEEILNDLHMIAAMANLLEYDIYDLELASVKDNTDLRKLLIETSSKSIIVIEDIDCSLDLTGQRNNEKKEDNKPDPISKIEKEKEKKGSEVTLSGLLNFIDGLWSACGSERLIVFTTNHIKKLDPALIRRGRMDKHIEMSYCCFETFKVLAKNYLDVEWHELFETVERLLGETEMTPADVAESLMPKSDEEDVEVCLKKLIKCLEDAKEAARVKALEENGEEVQESDEESSDEEEDDEESDAREENT
ncbi:hypothetical protein L1987_02751 [Smallanthus sonchifolius]|uniref:Uncharacterized protein n=1 Tax=Smallanthus sonchifolius TaxID=185202 RepID=A0ACB9K8T3_9ASTR|nr:hypothetical protein L1987_02751 [Smallanthus sonchifolius]